MNCGPPCSPVRVVLLARTLEWVGIPSSWGSSWPRNQTKVSCIAGRFFTSCTTREAHINTQSHGIQKRHTEESSCRAGTWQTYLADLFPRERTGDDGLKGAALPCQHYQEQAAAREPLPDTTGGSARWSVKTKKAGMVRGEAGSIEKAYTHIYRWFMLLYCRN